jgi:hypothetical protein
MSEPDFATLLEISGPGIQPYSARGLTQTLAPIVQATAQRRTVNGRLHDLSAPQFRKYSTTISANDVKTPAVQDLPPGTILTVHCAAELSYKTGEGAPVRPVVPDSSYTDGDYTFYRPIMEMMVVSCNTSEEEWAEAVSWQLVMEEV